MNGLDIYINYLNAIIDNVDYYDTDKVSNKDNMNSISNLCRDIDDLSNMDKLYIIATGKPLFFSSLDFITDIVVTDYSLILENMVESEEIREEITRYCGNLLSQDSENYMSFDVNSVINFDDSMSTISDEISNGVEELSDTARSIFEQQDVEDLEEEDEDEEEYTEEIPKYDREEDDEDLNELDDEDFLYYDESEEVSQSEYIDADDLDDDESEFEDDYDSEFYENENGINLVDTLNSELSRGKPRYEIEDDEEESDDNEFEDDEDEYYLYEDSETNTHLNKWDIEDESEEDEDIDDDDSYYLEEDEDSETNTHVNKWDMEDESEDDEFDEDYPYSDKNTDINSDNSYNSYDSNLYYEDMLAEGVFSDGFHQDAWDKELEEDEDDDEFDYSEDDEFESEAETLNKWDRDDEDEDEEDEFDYGDEFDSDDSDYIAPSQHNNNLGKNGNSDASKKFEEAKIEKSFANQRDFGDNSKNIPDEELLLISGSNNNSEFGNTITTKPSSKSTEEIVAESIVKLSEGVLNIPNSLKNRLKVMKNLVEKDELE